MVAVWTAAGAPGSGSRKATLEALAGLGFSSLPFRVDQGRLQVDEL
jgi:hypothetical protein